MGEGDNTPVGGGYMPPYAPYLCLFSLIIDISYYPTQNKQVFLYGQQIVFMGICKKVKIF